MGSTASRARDEEQREEQLASRPDRGLKVQTSFDMDGARTHNYIRTATGRMVRIEDPTWCYENGQVDIRDIAHALAHTSRYGGHAKGFYCPAPHERVLTSDLRWVAAGDLRAGDTLVGFDEYPTEKGAAGRKRRRFRPSAVEHAWPERRTIVRLVLEDGSEVRAAAHHPWLVATKKSRNQKWMTCDEIAQDLRVGRKLYMHKFVDTWEAAQCRGSGWLAGIYDGEGSLAVDNRRGIQLSVAQRPGLVLNEMDLLLRGFGFHSTHTAHPESGVEYRQTKGGWREIMRALGTLRPLRLLETFERALLQGRLDKQFDGKGPPLQIVAAEYEGTGWVSGIQTTTRTYLCEGFGAHNSVAQHSVIASGLADHGDQLWGLLHDAPEAYMGDLVSPLKRHFSGWKVLEHKWDMVIRSLFRIPAPNNNILAQEERVKGIDLQLLGREIFDLLPFGEEDAEHIGYDADKRFDRLEPITDLWEPRRAKLEFLSRFVELTGDSSVLDDTF